MVSLDSIRRLRSPGTAMVLALVLTGLGGQALAEAWRFAPLSGQFPKDNQFTRTYDQRTTALATAVNDYGHQFGVFRLPEDRIRSYSVVFADNPEATTVSRDDFIPLAGGEPTCSWFFCSENPFGIQLHEGQAYSAWFNTALGTSPLPGSVPFTLFPGNFVAENRVGVVATTQTTSEGQFSAVLTESGHPRAELADIPWVVALSQGNEPLVLGYRGEQGHCLVYGEGCEPSPCESDDEDGHHNQTGRGHREHGQGHGYGHHKDHCDEDHDDDDEHEHDDDEGEPRTSEHDDKADGAPVLIRVFSDNTTRRWQFPERLAREHGRHRLRNPFPLTMNDDRVVLRATVEGRNQDWTNRLLECRLDDVVDANGDDVVDCRGGLRPLLPLDSSRPVDTVLGFSLNAAGLLMGNYGFSAAGIGAPFMVDTTASEPRARLLRNGMSGARGWELNTITDTNEDGMAVGYGYRDCSAEPDAFTLYPEESVEIPGLAFEYRLQPENSAVTPGDAFEPEIAVSGGSGEYLYQMASKRPGDAQWQTEHGWQARPDHYQSSEDYRGDVCLRIRVQDSADADKNAEQILRIRVSEAPSAGAREQDLVGDRENADAMDMIQIGPVGWGGLLGLTLGGAVRRRRMR